MCTFEFEIAPSLEHHNLVILSSIFKKHGRFENLCKLCIMIWNRNSANLRRSGVTAIYVEDVIFEGTKNGIFYSTIVKIQLANTCAICNLLTEDIFIMMLLGMGEEGKKKEELHNIRPKSSKTSQKSEFCLNPTPFFF